MTDKIDTIATAVVSTGMITATEMAVPSPDEVQSIGQLIIQTIIGIITIWKLLKKPKPKKSDEV